MPLQRDPVTGKISRNQDGKLACAPDDCCNPPPCPDCCVQISSGALIDGVIKIFAFDGDRTLEITITTPSGTRTVCEDDEIELVIEYFINDELPSSLFDASLIVDPAWQLISVTPAADGDDYLFDDGPGGWMYWNDEELDIGQPSLGATLKFNSCYFNFLSDLGAIVINVEGLEEVIAIERCNESAVCCSLIAECEPCCLLLDPLGDVVNYNRWIWNEELQRFEWLHKIVSSDGEYWYWAILWIRPAAPTDPEAVAEIAQWCYDETWEFGVDITAGNFETSNEASDTQAALLVEACEFGYVPDPTPAGFTVDYAPLTIEWEPDEIGTQKQYEWALLRNCEFPGCDTITVTLDITSPTNTFVNTGEPWVISFFECEVVDIDGCECGCPCCGGNLPDELVLEWDYAPIDPGTMLPGPSQHFEITLTRVTLDEFGNPIDDPCENSVQWVAEDIPAGDIGLIPDENGNCSEREFGALTVEHVCGQGFRLLVSPKVGGTIFAANKMYESPDYRSECTLPFSFHSEANGLQCSDYLYTLREA